MASDSNFVQLALDAGRVFTPGAPIDEKALFAGRTDQVRQVVDAVSHAGQHAVIYGERGVGKTSLASVLSDFLRGAGQGILAPRVNCDGSDTYSSLWRKAFSDIELSRERQGIGFQSETTLERQSIADQLPTEISPDDVRRTLTRLSRGILLIVIFDEFDRLPRSGIAGLMADTIKMLSDHSVSATLVIVGVADSVDQLIKEHQSIERALVQIPMPRMSRRELTEIIEIGLSRLGMTASNEAADQITTLSQGLPYYTHLLGLHASREALDRGTKTVELPHVDFAIRKALEKSQQSIRNAYYIATKSPRRDNLFKQVLLACALAKTDEFGYFTASALKIPLKKIMQKSYDIPSFARHLKEFCETKRGLILCKTGESHRVRFRFSNPLMQPFVTLHGFSEGLIDRSVLEEGLQM